MLRIIQSFHFYSHLSPNINQARFHQRKSLKHILLSRILSVHYHCVIFIEVFTQRISFSPANFYKLHKLADYLIPSSFPSLSHYLHVHRCFLLAVSIPYGQHGSINHSFPPYLRKRHRHLASVGQRGEWSYDWPSSLSPREIQPVVSGSFDSDLGLRTETKLSFICK